MASVKYAHSLLERAPSEWEVLEKHLVDVKACAATFAKGFGAEEWGSILGYCHDLGKGSEAFQTHIGAPDSDESADAGAENRPGRRVDHSTFGARYVTRVLGKLPGALLAFCIAGHHTGLPDWNEGESGTDGGTLQRRLDEERQPIPFVPDPELSLQTPKLPWSLSVQNASFSSAFFTRMLFSALIDSDRTCTEAFCQPAAASERQLPRPSLAELQGALASHMERMQAKANPTEVNRQRSRALADCLAAASLDPGFFSLQVPTGGGKTLASLSFALEHARTHGLQRVVVAIPFTSIIEQTADVYRQALGSLAGRGLVEHHTNLKPERETRANQLGTENWDAPVVVTTSVQLFESLFAAATTPCRKLHRLARSVIILDEAHTLPVELLEPTLAALRELVQHYGCTVVLCTATQPALEHRSGFEIGLKGVRPIIAEPRALFQALKRVQVQSLGPLSDEALASQLADTPRVLTIVNTRPHAAKLFDLLAKKTEPGACFHLSTLMCGAHRRHVLARVRERLSNAQDLPCCIVSTQLIEAGVDLSVPVVYRAAAGLDSLAQAAGRCNREGEQPVGYTFLFEAEEPPPPGYLRRSWQAGSEVLPRFKDDPLAPEAIEAYFKRLYWDHRDEWDKGKIMKKMEFDPIPGRWPARFQFREIAAAYKIIKDDQEPILVPYNETARKLLQQLDGKHVEFVSHRQLQPYLVSVPRHTLENMEKSGVVRAHDSGVWMLLREDVYTEAKGLKLDDFGLDPRAWFV